MKKNIENSDVPIIKPTMLAPRSVRRRKIENGTSGPRERRSIGMNTSTARPHRRARRSSARAPADVDGVDESRRRGARGPAVTVTAPGDVEVPRTPLGAALPEDARCEQRGDRPIGTLTNRPSASQAGGEHAAEQHAGRAAGARDRAPDAERPVALLAFGEGGRDDRQRRRRDDRCARCPGRRGRRSASRRTERLPRRTRRP